MTMYATTLSKGAATTLADDRQLDKFLATVERRAFQMARAALGNPDDALDVVQDAMLLLVKRYRHKPEEEWRLLFFRILGNRIRDIIRRRTVRNRFTGWLSGFGGLGKDQEADYDPFQDVPDTPSNNPGLELERSQSMESLNRALNTLPPRQLEAFMLRCWEGLSTAETAAVMKCSEGSVKTHYFRALGTLQALLEEHRND